MTKMKLNPWKMELYEEKDCPECESEKGKWGIVDSIRDINKADTVELQKSRLAICKDCEHSKDLYSRGWINYCDICGCMLRMKTRLKKSKCPIGKW